VVVGVMVVMVMLMVVAYHSLIYSIHHIVIVQSFKLKIVKEIHLPTTIYKSFHNINN